MKNISIKIAFLLAIQLFLISCEKDIELINPNEKRKNVVNTILTVDSTMEAIFYKSNLPLSNDDTFDLIKNATLEIIENGVAESLIFSGGDQIINGEVQGKYRSNKIVEAGKTYSLKVSGKDIVELNSTIKIPNKANISNPKIVNTKEGQELHFTLNDKANEENFYEIMISYTYYEIIYTETDTLFDGPFFDNAYLSENINNESPFGESGNGGVVFIFNDELFDGKNYNIVLNIYTILQNNFDDGYQPIDQPKYGSLLTEATLQISSVNKGLFEYNRSINQQIMNQGDPFSEAVQVKSNIKNGLGVFGARITKFFDVEL